MEMDGSVLLGVSGPQVSRARPLMATMKPVTSQRTICALVEMREPGSLGGRCMTPGSGTSTTIPITTVTTTNSLQKSSIIGNSATPPLTSKIVASSISCRTDDSTESCSLMYVLMRR